MFKFKLLLFFYIFLILNLLYSYEFGAVIISKVGNERVINGAHQEVDDVGNKYYYSNYLDIPELGDFRGHYKNDSEYKREFEGVVEEETVNFITLDKKVSGIDELTVVFCIEPNEIAMWIDGTDAQSNHYQDLTSAQQQEVSKTVSAATSLFASSGNYDYLSAGQLLVWKAVGTKLLKIPDNIKPEINQLQNIIDTYDMVPSFLEGNPNPNFELTYNNNNSRYEVILKDENGILDEHFLSSIIGIQGNFHIEDGPANNDLYIWTDTPQLTTQVITGKYNAMPQNDGERAGIKYKVTPTFINSDQDLVSGMSYEKKIQFDIHTKEAKGGVKLKKCGYVEESCEPLKGAVFGLYNEKGDLKNQKITDEKGEIKFDNLKLGKYYIKEIYAPDKYKLNDTKYEFEITKDGEVVLLNQGNFIENELVKGTVSLRKVGVKNNNDSTLYPLKGVEFTIYKDKNENGELDEKDYEVQKLKTDENGEIHSDELEYGKYIIKETKTIDGYINNGYEETFFIKNDNENIELLGGMDLVNDILKAKVDLIKEGEVICKEDICDNILLEGVEFIIYKDENSNQKIDDGDIKVETLITDNKGYAKSHDLIYGDYIIKEVKTLPGYELLSLEYPFFISGAEDLHLNYGNPIVNKLKTKQIQINKKDQFENKIPSVGFVIYKDLNKNGEVDSEDYEVQSLTTDENGYAKSQELSYGNYILVEAYAPQGYIVNFSPLTFVINDKTYEEDFIFDISNELIVGDVKIVKRDNDTEEFLENVIFELYKDENTNGKIDKEDTVVGTYTTDENGEIFIEDLPYGKYLLKESKAQDGYYLSKQLYKINIDGTQNEYVYNIYNQKIVEKIVGKLVNTSNKFRMKVIVILSLLVIIIISKVIKYRTKKQNYI